MAFVTFRLEPEERIIFATTGAQNSRRRGILYVSYKILYPEKTFTTEASVVNSCILPKCLGVDFSSSFP
jgi:hypothetical protein